MSKITVTTIAGATSGADANKVKIESGDTLEVVTNATVGGTLGVTGVTTLTGDLTVDTNTLKVDSSNNLVGIGTSSPLSLTGNAAPGLTVSSNGPFILLQDANNANKVRYISNNTGELQLGQVDDDGSTNKTLHLNVSTNGHVTVPNQPAHMQSGMAASSGAYMTGGATRTNNGGMTYTSSNGRITVPVSGVYALQASAFTSTANGKLMIQFYKNGSQLTNSEGFAASTSTMVHDSANIFYVTQLSANDYVQVFANSLTTSVYNGGGGNMFGVFLVG